MNMNQQWKIGILLFENVEVLDFAGPFEVFSVTAWLDQTASNSPLEKPFIVNTISEDGSMVNARNGLRVQPDYSFVDATSIRYPYSTWGNRHTKGN